MVRIAVALLALSQILEAAVPGVDKVEPPSWWAGHSINPVELLVHGRDLGGARVESDGSALGIGRVSASASGTYLFVEVTIAPGAPAGAHDLRVITAGGATSFRFDLFAPLPREGRFQGFSEDDVIYLVMPDRFSNGDTSNDNPPQSPGLFDRTKSRYYHGGDFAGIRRRLPYLKQLGVTALWMTPIYDNANRLNERERYDNAAITDYHGYGAVDFYGVEEHLGSLAELRAFVDEAHRLGIKVIQDQVANHTGPYHPWVKDSPAPQWFHGTESRHLANTWQTWTLMDPHATPQLRRATLDGWFIDILPDLDQEDPAVARYLIQNTLWWAGMLGLDGIRQDTVPYVPRAFWRDWMAAIQREYPRMRVVGEVFDGDPAMVSFFQRGRAAYDGIDAGFDSLFDFPLFYAIRHAFAEGKPVREVASTLGHDHLYPNPNALVTFLGLHDVGRFLHEKGATPEGLRLAFTFLMTTRGIPMIYYGDEIAMTGGNDPDNRRDFPGGWAGDPHNAFEASGRSAVEQQVFSHVSRMTAIRREHVALRRGTLRNLLVTDQQYAYARIDESETVVVVLNNAGAPGKVEFETAGLGLGGTLRDLMGGPAVAHEGGKVKVMVPARGAVVLVGAR